MQSACTKPTKVKIVVDRHPDVYPVHLSAVYCWDQMTPNQEGFHLTFGLPWANAPCDSFEPVLWRLEASAATNWPLKCLSNPLRASRPTVDL